MLKVSRTFADSRPSSMVVLPMLTECFRARTDAARSSSIMPSFKYRNSELMAESLIVGIKRLVSITVPALLSLATVVMVSISRQAATWSVRTAARSASPSPRPSTWCRQAKNSFVAVTHVIRVLSLVGSARRTHATATAHCYRRAR